MRKMYRITNIALIFTLVILLHNNALCEDLLSKNSALRVPSIFKDWKNKKTESFNIKDCLKKSVVIFPSPSSGQIGMGKTLYDSSDTARELYDKAARILGYKDVSRLFLNEDDRKIAEFYTICTIVYSVVMYNLFVEYLGGDITFLATSGSSAGQMASAIITEAISFEDGLRVIQALSRDFSRVLEDFDYAIIVISGLNSEAMKPFLSAGEIEMLQDASPAFITIAAKRGVDFQLVMENFRSVGAKHVQLFDPPLFKAPHLSFYEVHKQKVIDPINAVEIKDPKFPIVSNITGRLLSTAEDVRQELIEQNFRPVLWRQVIRASIKKGAKLFIELGPGSKLSALNKFLAPGVESTAMSNPKDFKDLATVFLKAFLDSATIEQIEESITNASLASSAI